MKIFQNYLASIDNDIHRTRMEHILLWVKNTFPNVSEKIAWNQPIFTAHETFIIGFSISKQHIAVSPEAKGITIFSNDIAKAGYSQGTNIFRIKWEEDVNFTLLKNIIQYNLEDKKNCSAFWRK